MALEKQISIGDLAKRNEQSQAARKAEKVAKPKGS